MTAIELKAELACYWRFVRQMKVVAIEADNQDVLVVDKSRLLIFTEVKSTMSDLRNDIFKPIHHQIRVRLGLPPFKLTTRSARREYQIKYCQQSADRRANWQFENLPARFYFGVDSKDWNRAAEIIESLYPYAGLLTVRRTGHRFLGAGVDISRDAQRLHKTRLHIEETIDILKMQSASLANAYSRLARLERNEKN